MIWGWKESIHPTIHTFFTKVSIKMYDLPKKGSIWTTQTEGKLLACSKGLVQEKLVLEVTKRTEKKINNLELIKRKG